MAVKAQWLRHITAWQAGDLKRADNCRQHRLNIRTFSARLSEYRKGQKGDLPKLIPVHVERGASASAIVLHCAGGHRLELPGTVPAAWLCELLRGLG
jgi:hypothetical protein